MEIIQNIPLEFDLDALLHSLRLKPGKNAGQFERLLDQAVLVANPKAIYKEAFIEDRQQDTVTIDSVTFTSRALRMNLAQAERVFPFIATCGTELDAIDLPADDFLQQFWRDAIKTAALRASISYLNDYLDRKYALGKTAVMNPGSGDATVWPIEQQKELFSLLGDVRQLIGVELTDSYLMLPNKTVSGIRFPTEVDFHTCQVCHRPDCPSRRAPFDEMLWHQTHGAQSQV